MLTAPIDEALHQCINVQQAMTMSMALSSMQPATAAPCTQHSGVKLTFRTARVMLCAGSARKAATGLSSRLDSVQVQVVGVHASSSTGVGSIRGQSANNLLNSCMSASRSCTHNMHHQRSDVKSAATAAISGTKMIANVQPPSQSAGFTVQPLPCQLQQQRCSTLHSMHTTTAQVHNMNACSCVHITTSVAQVGGPLYTRGPHRAMHVSRL